MVNGKETLPKTELHEFLNMRQQRRWIFPRAALVGLLAGIIALLFRVALGSADVFRTNMIVWAKQFPSAGWLFPVFFTMIGALVSVMVTRKFAPEAAGSGIPHLEGVLQRLRVLHWKRVLPVKFFAGIIAIGSGLALGREGPTVQIGGAVGDAVSRWIKVSERERQTLISAGAGAGLAAAFNAPLSGLIFVLEEVRRDFQPIVFGAAFIAAAVADIVARIGSNEFLVFSVPSYPVPPLTSLPVFAFMGVLAGFLGVLFNKGLLLNLRLFERIPKKLFFPVVAAVGGLIGLAGWNNPDIIGNGHSLVESVLQGKTMLSVIPLFLILRFLLTTMSYGTGAPGGIFAPLLVLGALIGLGVGELAHAVMPSVVPIPAAFAVVGMAAYFSAIVRAPLTGVMLIIEMTGNYFLMLPLLISCFFAYIIAEALRDMPIYEALLDKDLKRNGPDKNLKDPVIVEFTVNETAAFVGKKVSELGLPAGCILVSCSDGKHEWIPKANTRLEPHMKITAVVAPEASQAIEMLRDGCKKCI